MCLCIIENSKALNQLNEKDSAGRESAQAISITRSIQNDTMKEIRHCIHLINISSTTMFYFHFHVHSRAK